jgi:6-pyruvoyltetrahydropterin/6-carboxytetrahydropterin synthase
MKIAKEFNWEMGHRLPFHNGKCVNLHGHSYRAIIELEGDIDANGILLDYYDLKVIVQPIIDGLDHGFMVQKDDMELIDALKKLKSKTIVHDVHSTSENICKYFLDRITGSNLPPQIHEVTVTICETKDSYARETRCIKQQSH